MTYTLELRIVSIRSIDQFKNMYRSENLYNVWFEDGVPIAYDTCVRNSANMNPFFFLDYKEYENNESHTKEYFEQKIKLKLSRYNYDIDSVKAAVNEPVLVFPDDFKDNENQVHLLRKIPHD